MKTDFKKNGVYVFSNKEHSFIKVVLYGEILRATINGYQCIRIKDFIKNNNIEKVVFKSKL